MTDTPSSPVEKAAPAAPVAVQKGVSGNSALVEFPRDEYGSMTALRKELLLAASTIRGNDAKQELFLETLKIGILHARARLASDKAALQAELDAEEARINRYTAVARVHTRSVEATEA